jgi:two-component system NtrC family response regulator
MDSILIVDDEKNYQIVLKTLLSQEGYEVLSAGDGITALRIFQDSDIDLVITDLKMSNMSGLELLERIKALNESVPVIIMTAYGTIDTAVEAMKKHAYDFITKPFENERLISTVRKALENYRLRRENILLKDQLKGRFSYQNIVGKSKEMQKIFDIIQKVSPTKSSVLVTGPSGTGKELIAKAIHYNSVRKDGPFVAVNCAAIPETLLESELFGHEKGAFTGAVSSRKGRFELADGGTLFLDEVGEMSLGLQVKLLRVLQEMEFERVGGTKTIKVDVRILAASNRDLKEEVKEGRFREDLYYRLNVIHIKIPALRERLDDLPLLVEHFLNKFRHPDEPPKRLSQEVWKVFYSYPWPGNIRELENVLERAVVLSNGEQITLSDIPEEIKGSKAPLELNSLIPPPMPLPQLLDKIEEELVKWALKRCNNVQAHAANLLGITKSLMQHKLKKYNIAL